MNKSAENTNEDRETALQSLQAYQSYKRSKYLSIKHSSYFQVYEDLLSRYRGRKIIFVEVGVFNGGSLFMWRDFFGHSARIIGIDLNPLAKKWEADGFEIHIGSQSDASFWTEFFAQVGPVDVILDDGGHTNEQQIVTSHEAVPHIKDGGMLIVEDTHCSYAREFGNPSTTSFISYAKTLVDVVNSRFPDLRPVSHPLRGLVYSVGFYQSIVCFHIDRSRSLISTQTSNDGISSNVADYRYHPSSLNLLATLTASRPVTDLNGFERFARKVIRAVSFVVVKIKNTKLRKYF